MNNVAENLGNVLKVTLYMHLVKVNVHSQAFLKP